jgi:hypothetical protein
LKTLALEAIDLPGGADAARFVRSALTCAHARAAVGRLAQLAAAAALRESAPVIAELFSRTRLHDCHGALFGTGDFAAGEIARVIDRALPAS